MGTVPSGLGPGLWVIGNRNSGPECESSMKEVVEGMGSGLVGL